MNVDGNLLLSMSDTRARAYRVGLIDVHAPEEGVAILGDRGVLALPPLVDGVGVTLAVRESQGATALQMRRSARLTYADRLSWARLGPPP